MTKFFVPISNDSPTAVEIKGHRILLLSAQEIPVEALQSLGATSVLEIEVDIHGEQSVEDQLLNDQALTSLNADIATHTSGVAIAPEGISIRTMLQKLERELSWVH